MVEKNMVTLTERTIMKSRSGVYSDTSENRRKHRVGQKYGSEKQPEDGEKTEKKETDPAKELEAVNKVIASINEGKLNLPAAEVMKLSEKKQKLEAAKKQQAEKVNSGIKVNEENKNETDEERWKKLVSDMSDEDISKKLDELKGLRGHMTSSQEKNLEKFLEVELKERNEKEKTSKKETEPKKNEDQKKEHEFQSDVKKESASLAAKDKNYFTRDTKLESGKLHSEQASKLSDKEHSDEEVTGGEKNIVEYRDEFIKTSKSPSVTKTLETKVKYDNGIRTKAENIEKLAQNGIFSERNIEHDRIKASKDHPDAFYTAGGYMREIDKESYILDGYYCSKTEFEYSKFLQNKLKQSALNKYLDDTDKTKESKKILTSKAENILSQSQNIFDNSNSSKRVELYEYVKKNIAIDKNGKDKIGMGLDEDLVAAGTKFIENNKDAYKEALNNINNHKEAKKERKESEPKKNEDQKKEPENKKKSDEHNLTNEQKAQVTPFSDPKLYSELARNSEEKKDLISTLKNVGEVIKEKESKEAGTSGTFKFKNEYIEIVGSEVTTGLKKQKGKSQYLGMSGHKRWYGGGEQFVETEKTEKFSVFDEEKMNNLLSKLNGKKVGGGKIDEKVPSREESKSEPKQGENEESYTRVKFDDVPNSGKINLKKYLTDKVRKGADEKWSSIKKIPTENLKKMEKGLVNDLNKNFEAIKKSQRAELLYSIMKVRGELESRGKETQKKE